MPVPTVLVYSMQSHIECLKKRRHALNYDQNCLPVLWIYLFTLNIFFNAAIIIQCKRFYCPNAEHYLNLKLGIFQSTTLRCIATVEWRHAVYHSPDFGEEFVSSCRQSVWDCMHFRASSPCNKEDSRTQRIVRNSKSRLGCGHDPLCPWASSTRPLSVVDIEISASRRGCANIRNNTLCWRLHAIICWGRMMIKRKRGKGISIRLVRWVVTWQKNKEAVLGSWAWLDHPNLGYGDPSLENKRILVVLSRK